MKIFEKVLICRDDVLRLLLLCFFMVVGFSFFAFPLAQAAAEYDDYAGIQSIYPDYDYGIFSPERVEVFSDVMANVGGKEAGSVGINSAGNEIYDSPLGDKTFIIFRDDDIAPFWSFFTVYNITETFRSRNVPHVVSLIPIPYGNVIGSDPILCDYLLSIRNDESVEFSLHGNGHSQDEYGDISFPLANFSIAEGLDIIENLMGIRPVSFVPPFHAYNDNTISALRENGVSIISSGTDDVYRGVAFMEVDGVTHLPATTAFYDWGGLRYTTFDEITTSCEYSMDVYGGCVIMLHHHMFVDSRGNLDPSKIQVLTDVLDWAKAKEESGESEILTFRDMLSGDEPQPLIDVTILSPTAQIYYVDVIDLDIAVSEVVLNLSYSIDDGDDVFLCSDCDSSYSSINLSLLSDGSHTLRVDALNYSMDVVSDSVSFDLDLCIPQWICGGYGDCEDDDFQYCNVSIDVNGCYEKSNHLSDQFSGDVGELGNQSCDYCVPEWTCGGYGGCMVNDSQLCVSAEDQNGCYAQTSLSSDQFTGEVSSFEMGICDYCIPDWVLNDTWSTCLDDMQYRNYYDMEGCYAMTNMTSDVEGMPDDVNQTCDNTAPHVVVYEPYDIVPGHMSPYVRLNVSTDEVADCSYVLNGDESVVLFSGMTGGAKTILGHIGGNMLNISCIDEYGNINDSVYLLFDVVRVSYDIYFDFHLGDVPVIGASFVNMSLVMSDNGSLINSNMNITEFLFNPMNSSFGAFEIGRYVDIAVDGDLGGNLGSVLLRIFYDDESLGVVDEGALAMYWFNESSVEWVKLDDGMDWVYGVGVNVTANYVWANVSHFSTYGVGGKIEDGGSCLSADECAGGNCVHGVCRSSNTYCGDSHCDSDLGESCSSCNIDCGDCSSGGSSNSVSRSVFYDVNITFDEDVDDVPVVEEEDVSVEDLPSDDGNGEASGQDDVVFNGSVLAGLDSVDLPRVLRNVRDDDVGDNRSLSDEPVTPTGAYLVTHGYSIFFVVVVVIIFFAYLVRKR